MRVMADGPWTANGSVCLLQRQRALEVRVAPYRSMCGAARSAGVRLRSPPNRRSGDLLQGSRKIPAPAPLGSAMREPCSLSVRTILPEEVGHVALDAMQG